MKNLKEWKYFISESRPAADRAADYFSLISGTDPLGDLDLKDRKEELLSFSDQSRLCFDDLVYDIERFFNFNNWEIPVDLVLLHHPDGPSAFKKIIIKILVPSDKNMNANTRTCSILIDVEKTKYEIKMPNGDRYNFKKQLLTDPQVETSLRNLISNLQQYDLVNI